MMPAIGELPAAKWAGQQADAEKFIQEASDRWAETRVTSCISRSQPCRV